MPEAIAKCNEIGDCAGVSKTAESGYALKGTNLERKLDGAHAWLKHYAKSIGKNTEVSKKCPCRKLSFDSGISMN